jgi:hypothetical protein
MTMDAVEKATNTPAQAPDNTTAPANSLAAAPAS